MNSENVFLDVYIAAFIKPFRKYVKDVFEISISGLESFIDADDIIFCSLLEQLKDYDFAISFDGAEEISSCLRIKYIDKSDNTRGEFDYQIVNLLSIIELSCKTDIPCTDILIMKVVSKLICKYRILYKAFVFDLDETLWPGILSEDGIDKINEDLHSAKGTPFIAFMKYAKVMAEELGVFLVICSRNDAAQVEEVINRLDEEVFPLKGQIDCIIANNNAKSENIKAIASQLSILPSAIVFIDDNKIVRDEVRSELPEVFIPEWNTHEDLVTNLNVGCVFERYELSLNSRKRRKQFRIIQIERKKIGKPSLLVKARDDDNHEQAKRLYAKSNQFKFMKKTEFGEMSKSLYFEMFRENGENLGICSALTYTLTETELCVSNWAISCRYFEIGLEEFILLHIMTLAGQRHVSFYYQQSELNGKAQSLLRKYLDIFRNMSGGNVLELICKEETKRELKDNTNLKAKLNG